MIFKLQETDQPQTEEEVTGQMETPEMPEENPEEGAEETPAEEPAPEMPEETPEQL